MGIRSVLTLLLLLCGVSSTVLRRQDRFQDLGYSESIARHKLMPMSAAAYADDPEACVQKVFDRKKTELLGSVNAECDVAGDTCHVFVLVAHEDQAIVISFRGAEDGDELKRMLNDKGRALKDFAAGGKVAAGYLDAVTNFQKNGLNDFFLEARNENPHYQIWITGHNIGGAMASVYAAQLIFEKKADAGKLLLMTFGQPRTGDKDFARAHENLLKNSYRVVHARDEIVHLPPLIWTSYDHHNIEVWYNNAMKPGDNCEFCKKDEDRDCSDGLIFTNSLTDDYYYFATPKSINDWGKNGCQ